MRISDWSSDVCSSDLNVQLGRHLIERQSHLEPVFVDLQVPIAILDDDRHLVGKALQQMLWDIHAGRARAEGDVEMMGRSEEHTSELQSLMRNSYAVFCLKKKKITINGLAATTLQIK